MYLRSFDTELVVAATTRCDTLSKSFRSSAWSIVSYMFSATQGRVYVFDEMSQHL
jgi:hypothetical protein